MDFCKSSQIRWLHGVGNSIVTDSVEKNYKDFKKMSFINGWIVMWCSCCLLCLYQPFIKIWLGEKSLFDFKIVICLVIYFYVWKMLDIINLYKEADGLWEFDKYRPIVASIVNLVINISLVNKIGLYGIIISTIISIAVVIFPWSSYVLFREYFKGKYKEYILKYIRNTIETIFIAIFTYFISNIFYFNNEISDFLLKIIYCIVLPNILFIVVNIKNKDLKDSIEWIKEKIKIK